MKASIAKFLIILLGLSLSAAVFNPVNAAGACSVYLGDATINELFKDSVNQANDPDDFVEVKILDPAINFAVYSNWTIELCENNGPGNNNDADGCSGPISLSEFADGTYPWLVLRDGDVGSYFNFKTGFDAILLDENGDVIDYLSVDGHTDLEATGCTVLYDYQLDSPGAGDKFIFRNPDGTGDWDASQSAAAPPSEGGSNQGGGGGPPTAPDHFNINIGAGSANTCSPFVFSITAEDASNNPITDYTGTILITTSTANGNFSTVTATNSINPDPDADDNGSASYTFDVLDIGTVVLTLSNEHAETLTISVIDSSVPSTPAFTSTSAILTFSDNAFTIIDSDLLVAGDNVPIAGRDHSYQIQMIRKDPVSGSCGVATGYTGSKTLKMWRTKNILDPSLNDPVLAGFVLPSSDPLTDNGSITFVDGVAFFNGGVDIFLATADIGKFTIELADISNTFADFTISGTSAEQTVRPFGIGVDFNSLRDLDFADNDFIDDSTGSDLSFAASIAGSVFTQSGEDFAITVEGVLWSSTDDLDNDGVPDVAAYLGDNSASPSFGLEGETVTITATVVEPVGATPGVLTVNGAAGGLFNSFTAGSQTVVMTYSNVGIIDLNASLSDADYFLSGVNVTGLAPSVGRFNPYQYAVTASTVNSACNVVLPFTYSRQPFTTDITLRAENKSGAITDGYRGSYATLDVATELNIENSATNAAYDAQSFTVTESFSSGVIGSSQFDVDLTWNMPLQDETPSQVNIMDTIDEVTLISLSPVSAGSTDVRFGRLALDNVFGSELATLTMPMYTEYYNGSNFVLNMDDGCTVINDVDLIGGPTVTVGGGSSTVSVGSSTASNGILNIEFTSPGAGNTGDINVNTGNMDITLDLNSLGYPWLLFDWDGDSANDNDPSATATFGIFSGNPVQIYIQQTYQ